jgi:peptidyl-prolyl cis-trans isomerase SurA
MHENRLYALLAAFLVLAAPGLAAAQGKQPVPKASDAVSIVAVVNGDVISRGDVDNRRRLFALSTGLPVTADVLDRLTPQVTQQLIDERLRLQEAQRKRIVVQDKQVAAAIAEVESRNGMQPGGLARQLAANGVAMRTLIDQIRVQIAWSQLVRRAVTDQGEPSEADVADQAAQIKAQIGQPEFRVSEIFTPVANPSQDGEAKRFVDTVIQQLRAGAPFPVVAAQFSQSQTALQGGDLGWVQGNQLDPAVLKVVREMPVGAISNPIQVPGGYSIVTLRGKREVGRDPATMMSVRQVWLPFTQKLDPQNPTAQQIAQLEQARKLQASVKTCETVASPQMRQLLGQLPVGQMSQPLPNEEGIMLVMVCSKETKNLGIPTHDQLVDRIMSERVELISRQIMRDLQRKAVIDQRA